MKHQFFADYYDRLNDLFGQIEEVLTDLPTEALDWVPGPEMNSLAVLAAHTLGATRYWVETMSLGLGSERVRQDEFEAKGQDMAAWLQLVSETRNACEAALETLTLEDLDKDYISPMHSREFKVGWSIMHAIEHCASHVGHMQITKQMWAGR